VIKQQIVTKNVLPPPGYAIRFIGTKLGVNAFMKRL
jgi:hypothetical protein